MQGLRGIAIAALVLAGLVVAALTGCRSAAPSKAESVSRAQEPAGETPQPAGRTPEPVGPKPGQGCRQVTLEPPCTLSLFMPSPVDARGGTDAISYLVRYQDSKGREVTPYYLTARREDQPALDKFFKEEKHRVVPCQGGWTSAPCNDTPFLSGFPEPPVGSVTRRGR
jgi:hypothetical protein